MRLNAARSLHYALIPFMPFYNDYEILVNTIAQLTALCLICLMIQKKFFFSFVPR